MSAVGFSIEIDWKVLVVGTSDSLSLGQLHANKLTTLPPGFGQLSSLIYLDVRICLSDIENRTVRILFHPSSPSTLLTHISSQEIN